MHPSQQSQPLDVLFVSEQPLWPLDQGFKVHGWHMARAMSQLGLHVGVASVAPLPDDAPDELHAMHVPLPAVDEAKVVRTTQRGLAAKLRRRLVSYLGPDDDVAASVRACVAAHEPTAVIGVGIHAPLLMRDIEPGRAKRIWYAADELLRFHLSCLTREPMTCWPARLRQAAIHAAMERLFAKTLDGAIAVSPGDEAMLRRVVGIRRTVTIRNGVDLERFAPRQGVAARPRTLAMWGRLDFEPNVDALRWFTQAVWPTLRQQCPSATLRIAGGPITPELSRELSQPGVECVGYVDDLPTFIAEAAAVVLPMRCGGGIKNKLLEAAAMGKPILASPRAIEGLAFNAGSLPVVCCHDADAWVREIRRVWSHEVLAADLGRRARLWAERFHDWQAAAKRLATWLDLEPTVATLDADGDGEASGNSTQREAA